MKSLENLGAAVEGHAWVVIVRGVVAILFGVVVCLWPGLSIVGMVFAYGLYCVADGMAAFAGGFNVSFWQSVVIGTISLLAALVSFAYPFVTAAAVLYLIAGWSIARGVMEIVAAIQFRRVIPHEWRLAVAGGLSISGSASRSRRFRALRRRSLTIGLYAILFGVLLIMLGVRVRAMVTA